MIFEYFLKLEMHASFWVENVKLVLIAKYFFEIYYVTFITTLIYISPIISHSFLKAPKHSASNKEISNRNKYIIKLEQVIQKYVHQSKNRWLKFFWFSPQGIMQVIYGFLEEDILKFRYFLAFSELVWILQSQSKPG